MDGTLLVNRRENYKLMGVCFHHLHSGDVQDEPNVSKSNLYDIENRPIRIIIPWSDQYRKEMSSGVTPTAYELLAIPKENRSTEAACGTEEDDCSLLGRFFRHLVDPNKCAVNVNGVATISVPDSVDS